MQCSLSPLISRHFRQYCCYLFILLAFIAHASYAENLVSQTTHRLASLTADNAISHVLVVGGRPVALGANGSWVLDNTETEWKSYHWYPPGQIVSIASDDKQAFLLLRGGQGAVVGTVEKLSLLSGAAASSSVPSLPVQLLSAQAALLDGTLFVAGVSAGGVAQLLALDLLATQAQWQALQGWPGTSGTVTSMVAQHDSLLVTIARADNTGERLLQWKQEAGWQQRAALAGAVIEGSGRPMGQGHVLYLVKDKPRDASRDRKSVV